MRSLIWTAAIAIIVTASGSVTGQQSSRPAPAATVLPERVRVRHALQPTAVLDRILSFDTNGDHRISRDELPERMEGLVSRGDANKDGVLTAKEIIPLIDLQASLPERTSIVDGRHSMRLADIIADLKLPPETHNRALAIVTCPRSVDGRANVDFKTDMQELLSEEDYENYVAAVTRLRGAPRIIGGIGGARAPATPPR